MKKVYCYEDNEGTWFEEFSPLTEAEMIDWGVVYKGSREESNDETI